MSQLTIGGQTLDHFDGGVKPKLGQAPLLLHRNTLNLHRFKAKQSTQTPTERRTGVQMRKRALN